MIVITISDVLLAMEMNSNAPEPVPVLPAKEPAANATEKTPSETKRKVCNTIDTLNVFIHNLKKNL